MRQPDNRDDRFNKAIDTAAFWSATREAQQAKRWIRQRQWLGLLAVVAFVAAMLFAQPPVMDDNEAPAVREKPIEELPLPHDDAASDRDVTTAVEVIAVTLIVGTCVASLAVVWGLAWLLVRWIEKPTKRRRLGRWLLNEHPNVVRRLVPLVEWYHLHKGERMAGHIIETEALRNLAWDPMDGTRPFNGQPAAKHEKAAADLLGLAIMGLAEYQQRNDQVRSGIRLEDANGREEPPLQVAAIEQLGPIGDIDSRGG